MSFWNTLLLLLRTFEDGLSRWCVSELDPGMESLRTLFPPPSHRERSRLMDLEEVEGAVTPRTRKTIWGRWSGAEIEYFRKCAALVDALDVTDLKRILGPPLSIFCMLTRDSHRKLLDRALPDRLRVGHFGVIGMGPDVVRVLSYRIYDPTDIPTKLFDILHRFDGVPTREAIRIVGATEHVEIEEALISKLVDFEILVPSESV